MSQLEIFRYLKKRKTPVFISDVRKAFPLKANASLSNSFHKLRKRNIMFSLSVFQKGNKDYSLLYNKKQ